jgi:general secretion pathway protein H
MARSGQDGFTLIELLVVLAIMGLMATLALPLAARAVDDAALRRDARALASRLHALQSRALEDQQTILIESGADGTIDVATLGLPVQLHGAALSVRGGPLSFYPDGTSSGGTIRMTEHGRTFDLDIAWLTGTIILRAAP